MWGRFTSFGTFFDNSSRIYEKWKNFCITQVPSSGDLLLLLLYSLLFHALVEGSTFGRCRPERVSQGSILKKHGAGVSVPFFRDELYNLLIINSPFPLSIYLCQCSVYGRKRTCEVGGKHWARDYYKLARVRSFGRR